MVKRDKLKSIDVRIFTFEKGILGKTFVVTRGYMAVSSGNITDEMIQEGENVTDDSQFLID